MTGQRFGAQGFSCTWWAIEVEDGSHAHRVDCGEAPILVDGAMKTQTRQALVQLQPCLGRQHQVIVQAETCGPQGESRGVAGWIGRAWWHRNLAGGVIVHGVSLRDMERGKAVLPTGAVLG
ncbi:hypothetical protein D3C78_421980 [compost metagenome]